MESSQEYLPEQSEDIFLHTADDTYAPSSEDGDHSDDLETCKCCAHKFSCPSGVFIFGRSQSGKSALTADIILQRRHLFTKVPQHVIYVYSCWQEKYDHLQQTLQGSISFRTDIPSTEELQQLYNDSPNIHRLLVIDDKFQAFKGGDQGRDLLQLSAVTTHHCLFTVFYISQSIFHTNLQKEISLNCQYLIICNNARSQQQVRVLGSQIFGPGQLTYFADAYKKALTRRYGYLLVDIHQDTPEKYRLKSHILKNETLIVYLPMK